MSRNYTTVIGRIVVAPTTRTTRRGAQPVVDAVLYDNLKPQDERRYAIMAFGSAMPTLLAMQVGSLVQLRGRLFLNTTVKDGCPIQTRTLIMVASAGTRVLRAAAAHRVAA
jgi:hypothetical protein